MRHELTNIDLERMRASCAVCGRVAIVPNGRNRSPRCSVAKSLERGRRTIGQNYQAPKVGTCPICKRKARLVFDHCHVTGNHRGMICERCNMALGLLRDSVAALHRAIDYLK